MLYPAGGIFGDEVNRRHGSCPHKLHPANPSIYFSKEVRDDKNRSGMNLPY